jgi:NADP-dependent 3-hydroxy acid dehydrogenase YdfG
LSTINVTQAFLPLIRRTQSRIIIATPNILGSLCLPYAAIENVSVNALEAFIKTLRRETKQFAIPITHIKIGTFDFGVSRLVSPEKDHRILNHKFGNFNPSSPGELHSAIFDALTMKHPWRTRRVGSGSIAYDFAGRLLPGVFVDWMIGTKKIPTPPQNLTRSIEGWESVVGEN